ncbi:hypothetical protein [Kamptonema sp. UHCC 0994]|uniref:hypothetical protein n=1 Tax=Kamptonema sp. UHCC 0994 TaxID=3031329 RepID=UPI0023BA1458|nr:hypothetical protein [Kamptonema sp. UHCC 0994]MDF0555634.1 hypothetical protein [Kamptonema sp. UHCC 0994]
MARGERHGVELEQGLLVIDDTMLDKWYAKQMELVTRQWSGRLVSRCSRHQSDEPTVVGWG